MKTPHSCEEGRQVPDYRRVCHLLRRLGVTPNYTGFHQAARAACEAARRPELMLSLSKWLYPLVAREMNTTGAAGIKKPDTQVQLLHYSFSISIIRPTRRAWRPPSN